MPHIECCRVTAQSINHFYYT